VGTQSGTGQGRTVGFLLLFVLSLGWGFNWPIMKIALSQIPPWTFRVYSCLVGGGLLLVIAKARHQRVLPQGREWGRVALVALANITSWQMLLTYALLSTASGPAALLAYTMPLWVALIGAFLGDRIGTRLALSLFAGMVGIGLLLSKAGAQAAATPEATGLLLAGALCWAVGTQLQMRMHWQLPAMAVAGLQMIVGCLPMVPIMIYFEGGIPGNVSPLGWFCWGYMAVVAMAFGYASWFKLIEVTSAQVAAIASLLAPAIAVFAGALILHEPLGWREVAATIAIISGVALVRRRESKPVDLR
jgi:drug/metabolite transporter (DMT)-like permease